MWYLKQTLVLDILAQDILLSFAWLLDKDLHNISAKQGGQASLNSENTILWLLDYDNCFCLPMYSKVPNKREVQKKMCEWELF